MVNIKNNVNRILDYKNNRTQKDYSAKLNEMYGNNPFLDRNGKIFNEYVDYQKVLDNPNVTAAAKNYITQATGLSPSQGAKKSTYTVAPKTDYDYSVYSQPTAQSASAAATPSLGTASGNSLVDTAKKYLNTPYVWGGATPKGFDCSGLMQYVYKQNGINISRTSQEQFKNGTAIDKSNLQPGDLVFFKGSDGTASAPGHVGMYIGNNQYIQAPKTGDVVKISNLSGRGDYVGARRITK